MYAIYALERVNLTDAVRLGTALASPRAKRDPTLERLVDEQLNEAFPKD